MGDVGAYWDNAVVEKFLCSLKHDWISNVPQDEPADKLLERIEAVRKLKKLEESA